MKTVVSYYVMFGKECMRTRTYTVSPESVHTVKLLCLGYTYEEVAEKMYVTKRTIESRMSSLYRYYNLTRFNRLALLNLMVKDGLLTLPITETDV